VIGSLAAIRLQVLAAHGKRLGHLLERAGAASVLPALDAELATRRVDWVPLTPGEPADAGAAARDHRWHVLVSVEPEGD
jgi:hypothetical protein